MPPEDPAVQPDDSQPDEAEAPAEEPAAPDIAKASLSPEAVRNSPEFREIERQNRELARQQGAAIRERDRARQEAERQRQAAEAKRAADLQAELSAQLGEEGVTLYNRLIELSQSDPDAAAKELAKLISSQAQSPAGEPASPEPTQATAQPQEGNAVETPPAPPRGVTADAPLSQASRNETDEWNKLADNLDANFEQVVKRVQDPNTRNRTTMKDRAGGMIAYVAARLIRQGARPSS